jgi:CysZ protein
VKRIVRGFAYAFKGLRHLVDHRDLWLLSALPILLNVALFVGGTAAYVHYFGRILHAFVGEPSIWHQWILYVFTAIILVAVFALAVVFLFTAIGAVIAAPFLDSLTERVERSLGRPPAPAGVGAMLHSVQRSAVTAVIVIVLFVAAEAVLLALWLLPAVGQLLYAALAPLVAGFFLAAGFFDFPLSRRGLTPAQRMNFLWRRKGDAVGFGLAVFLTTLIPLLNFLLLPAAAVGATLLVLQIEAEET